MKRTEQPPDQPTPAPVIGTPAEQSQHRDPAPTVAEHNAAIAQERADGTLPRHW